MLSRLRCQPAWVIALTLGVAGFARDAALYRDNTLVIASVMSVLLLVYLGASLIARPDAEGLDIFSVLLLPQLVLQEIDWPRDLEALAYLTAATLLALLLFERKPAVRAVAPDARVISPAQPPKRPPP